MPEYTFMLALIAAPMLFGAWREYVNDNHRDAKLLAALSVTAMAAGGTVWLI